MILNHIMASDTKRIGNASKLFGRNILIVQETFGEQGKMAGIHLKNMFNVSEPGFPQEFSLFART